MSNESSVKALSLLKNLKHSFFKQKYKINMTKIYVFKLFNKLITTKKPKNIHNHTLSVIYSYQLVTECQKKNGNAYKRKKDK